MHPSRLPSQGQAVLTPAEAASLTVDELKDTHYVCFTTGALEGRWYEIAGNSATSLTIHLNGEDGVAFAPGAPSGLLNSGHSTLCFPPVSNQPFINPQEISDISRNPSCSFQMLTPLESTCLQRKFIFSQRRFIPMSKKTLFSLLATILGVSGVAQSATSKIEIVG